MNAADLDQLPTTELQHRAFALARHRRDWRFFIDLFRHTPAAGQADNLDPDVAEIGVAIDDLVAMWREATKGQWGSSEPLARAAFIDYLSRHGDEEPAEGESRLPRSLGHPVPDVAGEQPPQRQD